jgi:hypothetical protein
MDENEIHFLSKGLLLKLNVITGWALPDAEYLIVLLDQFRKKMIESYSTVNADEVEYAFRTFGTQVKDWGKQMNLSLIDEVMIPYLAQRSEVSKIEEQKKVELPPSKEDMSDEAMEKWLIDLKAQKTPFDLLPAQLYQWMVDKGKIWTAHTDNAILMEAIAYRKGQILKSLEERPGDRALLYDKKAFAEMLTQGWFEGAEKSRLETIAKRILIWDYLNTMK